jgi:hypothetical protein
MAKITARGATEVARATVPTGSTWVLTSDGRILRKSGLSGDGFIVASRLKAGVPVNAETLQRILVRRGLAAA